MIRSVRLFCLPAAAIAASVALTALVGCSPGPDVPLPTGPAGTYPQLLPIDDILAQADLPPS